MYAYVNLLQIKSNVQAHLFKIRDQAMLAMNKLNIDLSKTIITMMKLRQLYSKNSRVLHFHGIVPTCSTTMPILKQDLPISQAQALWL